MTDKPQRADKPSEPTGQLRRSFGRRFAVMVAVDCRIHVRDQDSVRTVSVAGCLAAAHVPDLMMASGEISAALQVDLTDLISIDAVALDALRRIRDRGAHLVGAHKYIQIKLDSLAPGPRGF